MVNRQFFKVFEFFFGQVVLLFAEPADDCVPLGVHPAKLGAVLVFDVDSLFVLLDGGEVVGF